MNLFPYHDSSLPCNFAKKETLLNTDNMHFFTFKVTLEVNRYAHAYFQNIWPNDTYFHTSYLYPVYKTAVFMQKLYAFH